MDEIDTIPRKQCLLSAKTRSGTIPACKGQPTPPVLHRVTDIAGNNGIQRLASKCQCLRANLRLKTSKTERADTHFISLSDTLLVVGFRFSNFPL
ncbi:MAG TPA: hypothetical protein VFF81_01320 [Noviherbaspirillum sp.]|nr:hypothetical protein [Noviherbaspirillum sp.]